MAAEARVERLGAGLATVCARPTGVLVVVGMVVDKLLCPAGD